MYECPLHISAPILTISENKQRALPYKPNILVLNSIIPAYYVPNKAQFIKVIIAKQLFNPYSFQYRQIQFIRTIKMLIFKPCVTLVIKPCKSRSNIDAARFKSISYHYLRPTPGIYQKGYKYLAETCRVPVFEFYLYLCSLPRASFISFIYLWKHITKIGLNKYS